MATTYLLFFIVLIAFYYFCKLIIRNKNLEKFQDTNSTISSITSTNATSAISEKKDEKIKNVDIIKTESLKEKTPAETGLVFGYLPQDVQSQKLEFKTDSNTIYNGDSISINSTNLYLGMSDKNPLLPMFLETLGSFKPYEYPTVKIHIKNDDFNETAVLEEIILDNIEPKSIFYNKTIVCFTIKYLQDNYFLQYVPNTSTFYLTNKPSYFNLINAMDINTERIVKYGDSILLKCLDNSELVLIYDSFMVTEPNKSSTFTIKKSDSEDLCLNFSKSNLDLKRFKSQYIKSEEATFFQNIAKSEIDKYIAKLKTTMLSNVDSIKKNINLLENKRNNLINKTQMNVEKKRLEYKTTLNKEKEKVDKEIKNYQNQLNKELENYKKELINTKGKQWESEVAKFKKELEQKCK